MVVAGDGQTGVIRRRAAPPESCSVACSVHIPLRHCGTLSVGMAINHEISRDRFISAQGRILEELAGSDAVLAGTLHSLGRRFDLTPDDLRTCLRELAQAGWLAVQTQPFGRLTIRLERRVATEPPLGAAVERRRQPKNAWHL